MEAQMCNVCEKSHLCPEHCLIGIVNFANFPARGTSWGLPLFVLPNELIA